MAAPRRKHGSSGRVTPKGGTAKPPATSGRVNPDEPVQVGRRPSNPSFLLLLGVMWIAVGVIVLVAGPSGWKIILGIVAIGFGLFFLRGAGATVVRREQRRSQQ